MEPFETNSDREAELCEVFARLFPHGWAGDDVLRELAPTGWEQSPLLAVFHPSREQVYKEAVAMHHNLLSLRRADDTRPVPSEPTREQITEEYQERPIDCQREMRELVGQCLWDIFSNCHEVVDGVGRVLDLGSFRGTGGFLADLLNKQVGRAEHDYLSFYMGTLWIGNRADLTPVYQMICRRLRSLNLDWVYHFPRLHAVDMRPLKHALEDKGEPEWANYSPDEALAKDAEQQEHDQKLAELRESLDESYQQAIQEAMNAPPPKTVRAYEAVYGHFPQGWPPTP
jgi:hypothetical protein